VVKQAVEEGVGGRYIAEQFAPFFDGTIGGDHGGKEKAKFARLFSTDV